jgi:hypothetical protein
MDHLKTWMEKTDPEEPLHRSTIIANSKIIEYYNRTSDCYTISTILDPRFGLDYYKLDTSDKNDSYEDVFAVVNAVYLSYYCPASIQPSLSNDENDDFFFSRRSKIPQAEKEFELYCADDDPPGDEITDVLSWWKAKSKKYPNLSRMARDYLAIPATSTSSERLFSTGKHLISDTRNSLSPSTIQACQCLKSWLK